MDTTIEAHGLVKRFGDTTALGGVDLAARTGTVVAVLGPGPARVAAQLLPAGQGQGLEADGVDRLGGHGQPVAGGGDSTTPGSRRRRRETSAWRALAASAGGRSSETASTSWPEVTTRPGSSARRSNSRRSRAPATSTRWPEPARTSSGPRTPIRSSPDTPPFCPAAAPWPTGA
jgi:hypothetical protein